MEEIKLKSNCPFCNKEVVVRANPDIAALIPNTRYKGTRPSNIQFEINFTSEQLKAYLIDKARKYVKNVRMEVVPIYCEKKRRKNNEPHRAYSALRIGFSEEVIEGNRNLGWFGKIIEESGKIEIVKSLFDEFIKIFNYNDNELKDVLTSYKKMEYLEDTLGVDESFIKDIRMYAIPKLVMAEKEGGKKEPWIFFSASPEKVIHDMLTNPDTDKFPGTMQIIDTTVVSKGILEYKIIWTPDAVKSHDNPHVRQILMGNEKAKM